MKISRAGGEGLNWANALSQTKQPIKDMEKHLIDNMNAPEDAALAAEKTAEIVFGVPSGEVSSEQAISAASKRIQDEEAVASTNAVITGLKEKLASNSVDPVALKVVSKEEWDNCRNPKEVENIAKRAVEEQIKINKQAWQANSLKVQERSQSFNPETDKAGRIAQTFSREEDVAPVVFNQVPKNANSIFDTKRLDRLATETNEHDNSRTKSTLDAIERSIAASKSWRSSPLPEDAPTMNTGKIHGYGGQDVSVPSGRIPRNQISMLDNLTPKDAKPNEKPTAEALAETMSAIFKSRIPDSKADTRAANKARSEKIKRQEAPKEDKRSWEKVEKPESIASLQQRQIRQWTQKESPKE